MEGRRAIMRFGGIGGILFVALLIPAYVVGYPDAPTRTSRAEDVVAYFNGGLSAFLIANGVVTIFVTFFFLWFLGILHGLLRRADGEVGGFSSAALAGGLTYATLISAGFAVEILYPATLARFENFQQDPQIGFLSLVLSAWLYYFCQAGMSVLVGASSVVALRTGVLPGWLAWAGGVVALLALVDFLIPPFGGLPALLWVVAVSVLMLTGFAGLERGADLSIRTPTSG
jgi:hypothetical protein